MKSHNSFIHFFPPNSLDHYGPYSIGKPWIERNFWNPWIRRFQQIDIKSWICEESEFRGRELGGNTVPIFSPTIWWFYSKLSCIQHTLDQTSYTFCYTQKRREEKKRKEQHNRPLRIISGIKKNHAIIFQSIEIDYDEILVTAQCWIFFLHYPQKT